MEYIFLPIIHNTSKVRINFKGLLTTEEIDDIAQNFEVQFIQFNEPVNDQNWNLLEERLFAKRQDIALRVYGFYGQVCDISFLQKLPSLRHFFADCLKSAVNLECISSLKNIKTLSIGIDELTSFDFLENISDQLTKLNLNKTDSAKPSIESITRFKHLNSLVLVGHRKGFSAISELTLLKDLTLTSYSNPDLSFMNLLKNLTYLSIHLGGAKSLENIASLKNLRTLSLSWIRGLKDLSFVSRCENLETLDLECLKQVTELPDISQLKKLKWLKISEMKGLKNL